MLAMIMILIIIAGFLADIFDLNFGNVENEDCSEECKYYSKR